VVRAIGTDMGTIDMAKLGWLQSRLKQDPKDRLVLPSTTQTIDGQSFEIGIPDADEQTIRRFVGSS
jgi:hypothetical protein